MDDGGRWLVLLLFIVLGFFFSAAETALLSINEGKMKELIAQKGLQEKGIGKLFDQPVKKKIAWMDLSKLICLGTALVLSVLILHPAIQGSGWYGRLTAAVANKAGIQALNLLLWAVCFLLPLFVVLTFGNLLPKKLFAHEPERFLLRWYSVIKGISLVFRPLVFLMAHTANGLARLCGVENKSASDNVTEEEIRSLVDAGEETGAIHQEECEMINNIFDFDDCMASDLMTHRTDVVGVELNAKISDVVYYAINEGFSRIPVYENDIDNIKGVIYVKDLLCLVGCQSSEDFTIRDFIRETIYVPEAKKCIDLFQMFKTKKIHMAVVVDEYGGTAGIITMEDLLESIVGNIQDEYDDEQEEVSRIGDNVYLLSGSMELEQVEELFGVKLPQDEDTDRVGGLIVETLGRIPDEDENPSVEIAGIRFTVMVMEDRRVVKVKAEKLPEETENEETNANTQMAEA